MKVFVFILALTLLLSGRIHGGARWDSQTAVRAATAVQKTALPGFADYPSTEVFTGRAAPVLLDSARYGRTYRTRLRDGARKGPNFAGAFTVVVWGCGSSCQVGVVINANTGALSRQTLRATNGVEYRRESRLLIADTLVTRPFRQVRRLRGSGRVRVDGSAVRACGERAAPALGGRPAITVRRDSRNGLTAACSRRRHGIECRRG
jgi:hypothetical protein